MAYRDRTPWQSFADLAIGLMAVFALTLMLLLWKQNKQYNDAQSAAVQLQEQQKRFAKAILDLMRNTDSIVGNQDAAETWLRNRFTENDCLLRLAIDGRLEILSGQTGDRPPDLYDSGKTQLSEAGQEALRSCRDNFLSVAYAKGQNRQPDSPETAKDICRRVKNRLKTDLGDPADRRSIERLQAGLEALVLAGNTDRSPLNGGRIAGRSIPRIVSSSSNKLTLDDKAASFVENSTLGAERARQALGHLLSLVQACDEGPQDALELVMSRVRIESAAFGRYQAGRENNGNRGVAMRTRAKLHAICRSRCAGARKSCANHTKHFVASSAKCSHTRRFGTGSRSACWQT